MKIKILEIVALTAVLAMLGAACIIKLGAQPTSRASGRGVTTHWIGYLVVGKNDTMDQIARGPFPAAVPQVEIGLRSDGVVVWRSRSVVNEK